MPALERLLSRILPRREPDKVLSGDKNQPFLRRWYLLPRNRWLELFINNFMSSDPEGPLHDHPSWTLSLICKGRYFEHLMDGTVRERKAGQLVWRSPWVAHRIEIMPGEESWSLFLTGPKIREWCFVTDKGRIRNTEYKLG